MKDNTRTAKAKADAIKRKQQRATKQIAASYPPHNDEALHCLMSYTRRKSK